MNLFCISDHDVPFRYINEFLEHATQLKNINHQNVLSLAGVVLEDRIPLAVSQFTRFGDLKGFLMEVRKKPEVSHEFHTGSDPE